MKITKYPDNSSYVTVDKSEGSANSITFRINSYEDLWHLRQYVDAYYNAFGIEANVFIPNLFDAQADRRFDQRESSGLKLVCEFLNDMPAKFTIFHPHNPEVVEALIDKVTLLDNKYFIKSVLTDIYKNKATQITSEGLWYDREKILSDKIILMSADAGGYKSLSKLCDRLEWKGELNSCSKSRSINKEGKSVITQYVPDIDYTGKEILIVDDISVFGGTFKGLSKLLKSQNAEKLYLAVSHMTVKNLGNDPVTNYFDKVYTTNSKYDTYTVNSVNQGTDVMPDNLQVISMFDKNTGQ